jgi:serpin B
MKPSLFLLVSLLPVLVSGASPRDVATGNNRFAFQLFRSLQVGNTRDNQFCSPFSISTALAMVYAGARNETETQIGNTLHFPAGVRFHNEYKKLLNDIQKGSDGKIKLNIANGIWMQKDFQFLDTYIDLVAQNYQPELKSVDFQDAISRDKALAEINRWVEEKTNDKIKDLLGRDDLDRYTRMVLVNAIYFYGEWASPFKKENTDPGNFYISDESAVKSPFMHQRGNYPYFEDDELQALEIPYKDKVASMVVFLPKNRVGMAKFEKVFDLQYYSTIMDAMQPLLVNLALPKFKTEYKTELSQLLSQLGMPIAFSQSAADFSGMTGSRNLYITKVVHQAIVEVDELGTEAAAATAVVMTLMAARAPSGIPSFIADHPFIFVIKDNLTGSILFMGKIMKPDLISSN